MAEGGSEPASPPLETRQTLAGMYHTPAGPIVAGPSIFQIARLPRLARSGQSDLPDGGSAPRRGGRTGDGEGGRRRGLRGRGGRGGDDRAGGVDVEERQAAEDLL